MDATVSQAMYNDLKSAYDVTRELLALAANNREESNRAMDHLREQLRNQAETIRQLRTELAETKQAIAFWMDVNQLLAREKGNLLETVRQLRTELAETKQAMLLGVLSE